MDTTIRPWKLAVHDGRAESAVSYTTILAPAPTALALSPEGVVCIAQDRNLVGYRLDRGSFALTFEWQVAVDLPKKDSVVALCYGPGGRELALGTANGAVLVASAPGR